MKLYKNCEIEIISLAAMLKKVKSFKDENKNQQP